MPMGKTAVATLVLAMGQGAAGAVTRTVSWYVGDTTCGGTKTADIEFTQSESDPTCWAGPSWLPAVGFKLVRNGVAVSTVRFTDSDCTEEDKSVIGDDWSQNLPVSAVDDMLSQKGCMAVGGWMSLKVSEKVPADGIPDLANAAGSKLSTTAFVNVYPGAGCKGEAEATWFFTRVGKDSTCWKMLYGGIHELGMVQAERKGTVVMLQKHAGEDCSGTPTEPMGMISLSGAVAFAGGDCADLDGGSSIKALLPSTVGTSVVSGGLPASLVMRKVTLYEDATCEKASTTMDFVQSESDPMCWAGPYWMPAAGFKAVRTAAGVSLATFKDSDCTEEVAASDIGFPSDNFATSAVEEFFLQEGCLAAANSGVFLKMSESMPEDGIPDLSPVGTASQAAPAARGRWLAGWLASSLSAVAAAAASTAGSSSLL